MSALVTDVVRVSIPVLASPAFKGVLGILEGLVSFDISVELLLPVSIFGD